MRSITVLSIISIFGANLRSLYLFSAKIRGNYSFFFRISCILSTAAVCFQSYPHFSCSLSTVYSQPTYYLWQCRQLDDTSGLYCLWRHTLLSESVGSWRKHGAECWPPVFSQDMQMRREFRRLFNTLYKNPEKYIDIARALGKSRRGLTREELAGVLKTD